jgi:hypothetical protein
VLFRDVLLQFCKDNHVPVISWQRSVTGFPAWKWDCSGQPVWMHWLWAHLLICGLLQHLATLEFTNSERQPLISWNYGKQIHMAMSSLCSNVTSRTWRQNVIWPRLHAEHRPHLPRLSRAADCAACDNFFPFWVYYQYVNLRPHKLRNSCLISSDLSYLRGAVPRSLARTPTCVSPWRTQKRRENASFSLPPAARSGYQKPDLNSYTLQQTPRSLALHCHPCGFVTQRG